MDVKKKTEIKVGKEIYKSILEVHKYVNSKSTKFTKIKKWQLQKIKPQTSKTKQDQLMF